MIVHDKPLNWYIDKLKNNEYFSQGMLGDGEWNAIFHDHIDSENAEHTIYTPKLCDDLLNSLKFKSDNFYFSSPAGLRNMNHTGIGEERIDKCLADLGVSIEFYEKDMWDREVREMHFGSLIKQLRQMNVVIISNKALMGLDFLKYDKFIEVDYPNCHKDVDRVVSTCRDYNKSGVYIFAMGLPAILPIQQLHNSIPNSWFLDLGSVWDAFVGIGAQRGWRRELYSQPDIYAKWKAANLSDI